MLAPRPQIDEKCMENQKIFGWALSNPKFTHYLIMKYETYSSKICGILETILSSSFLPCSSILVWKLMVWIDWETPRPPPMGNRVKYPTVMAIGNEIKPLLCSKLALFKTPSQMFRVLTQLSRLGKYLPLLKAFQWGTAWPFFIRGIKNATGQSWNI